MGPEKSVEGTVAYAERDQVAWITLNRPDKLNALNRTVFAGSRTSARPARGE